MNQEKDYLQDLTEIRSMMEKSTRFISLSGLSGVFAGIFALIGAGVGIYLINDYAAWYYRQLLLGTDIRSFGTMLRELEIKLFITAAAVLFFALIFGYYFTARKAKKLGHQVWNKSSRQMLVNISLPLTAGGIFCAALYYHGVIGLIAPSMLIFYGLALINGSKFTLDDIRYLGYLEIALGLVSCFVIGYGLWFWAFGFGVLHIVYGISMYYKYEHRK